MAMLEGKDSTPVHGACYEPRDFLKISPRAKIESRQCRQRGGDLSTPLLSIRLATQYEISRFPRNLSTARALAGASEASIPLTGSHSN